MRVVESAAFIAAPLAGLTLAQLGAEVIRLDPIEGGLDRYRWPVTAAGHSLYWAGLNKGKRSVRIDIRKPEGRELATALVTAPGPGAGLFITNFPTKGWLAYESLQRRRADLIMVAITGNPDGSSAVDYTVNAATGFPDVTGPKGHDGPVNNVTPAWDLTTGVTAALGLIVAERQRRSTGAGQLIKLALSDVAFAAVGTLGWIADAQINGAARGHFGNDLFGAFGRDFATSDGKRVMVIALTLAQWQALLKATALSPQMGQIETMLGVDLSQEGDRYAARDMIGALLERWCVQRDFAAVSAAFDASGVCWGPYRDFATMVREDPRCSPANPMFAEIDQPEIGRYLAPATPLYFVGQQRLPPLPAPRLGEHTDAVLLGVLGLSEPQVGALHDRGIVAGPD